MSFNEDKCHCKVAGRQCKQPRKLPSELCGTHIRHGCDEMMTNTSSSQRQQAAQVAELRQQLQQSSETAERCRCKVAGRQCKQLRKPPSELCSTHIRHGCNELMTNTSVPSSSSSSSRRQQASQVVEPRRQQAAQVVEPRRQQAAQVAEPRRQPLQSSETVGKCITYVAHNQRCAHRSFPKQKCCLQHTFTCYDHNPQEKPITFDNVPKQILSLADQRIDFKWEKKIQTLWKKMGADDPYKFVYL